MRRTVVASLVLLVAIALMIGKFIMSGDWRYYRDPSLWLVVAVVAVLFGLAGLRYYRSNRATQIWLGILAWGAYAVAFTGLAVWFLYFMILSILSTHIGVPIKVLLMPLGGCVLIAAMFWWHCWGEFRKWRRYRDEPENSHADAVIRQ